MENGNPAVHPEEYKNRGNSSKVVTIAMFAFMAVFFLFLIYKLYDITVINNKIYAVAAADQQWSLMTYPAERGMIYDCNGTPLASNTYDYTVVCSPSQVKSSILSRDEIITACLDYLGVTYEKMDGILPIDPNDINDERNAVAGCDVTKNIPAETKDAFEAYLKDNKVSGFGFVAVPQRYYNYGSLAAQVIGYAKNDGVNLTGLYGLEAYYNDILSGTDCYRYSETDEITGGVLPYSEATSLPAQNGYNVVLNLDVSIQRIAEEACYEAYEKYQPIDGVCAIVIDPYTGAILAMVSLPNYDLNDPYGMPYGMDINTWNFMSDDDKIQYIMGNCWRNRCVSDTYEPGSTFKALTTCIAMEENLTNEDEVFSDAPVQISDYSISCWLQKSGGYNHGEETLTKAFENSCNPIFAQLALRIGVSKYYSYVRMLGFYDITGIDLPAEGKGIFHSDPQQLDMACLSFGESATVTPIQLLMSYCAIINGGDLLVPHIAKYITDSDGNIVDEIEPEVVRTVFSEDTCARVRALMEGVVSDGTGSAGKVPGYNVAGKTSTSTIETGELAGCHVLSFSCYAPADNPKIAVLVVINKPKDHSVGSSSAASTAAKIVEGTLTYMGVERKFNEDEYEELLKEFYVQKVDGMSASEAASKISTNGLSTLYGTLDMDADTIVAQTYPSYTATLYKTGVVVMYPEGVTESQFLTTKVPNLQGMTAIECIEACLDLNLNCKIDGDVGGVCVSQDYAIGDTVYAGEIIHVTLVKDAVVETTEPEETAPPEDGTVSEDGVVTDIAPPPDDEEDEITEGQDT